MPRKTTHRALGASRSSDRDCSRVHGPPGPHGPSSICIAFSRHPPSLSLAALRSLSLAASRSPSLLTMSRCHDYLFIYFIYYIFRPFIEHWSTIPYHTIPWPPTVQWCAFRPLPLYNHTIPYPAAPALATYACKGLTSSLLHTLSYVKEPQLTTEGIMNCSFSLRYIRDSYKRITPLARYLHTPQLSTPF